LNSRDYNSILPLVGMLLSIVDIGGLHVLTYGQSTPANAATSFDTKGTPFKGSITGRDGKDVATIEFFGEGTSTIFFDRQQRLILEDEKGMIIAGFRAIAVDHENPRLTQAYIVEEKNGSRSMALEHFVDQVEYKSGIFKMKNPQLQMLTSFKTQGDKLTVRFKSIDQVNNEESHIINRLTLTSDGDQAFEFVIQPSSSMIHILNPLKGDLVRHLTEKKKRLETGPPKDSTTFGKVAPRPLFRDPVYDGAADPVVIWNENEKCWFMFYTNRRANLPLTDIDGVNWVHGTRIGIAQSRDSGATWRYRGTATINYGKVDYTHWAPEVIKHNKTYHMFLTVVPGIFSDWQHPREIAHLTSTDLLNWNYLSTLKLSSNRVIDACVLHLPNGTWRLWYNNETDQKSIYYADSNDLCTWQDKGKVISVADRAGEGPKVFQWRNYYWMVVDVWKGLGIYRSDDATNWTAQAGNLLETPGTGADDQVKGGHPDVVVSDDRAFLFYFTHPGRANLDVNNEDLNFRRSSIQVAELEYKDGWLSCDRTQPTYILLEPPDEQK